MRTKETAAQAYQRNQEDIGALLSMIGEEAKRHAAFAKAEGEHWGMVGDVFHARTCMVEVLAFLAQQDEAFIEKRLSDARQGRK
jgi:hypothetical protein